MDEAEKYQQRLQAIAEKRRMQEEQERAKRDMEDERLRLQQLKRKSLRDQWLMEGPLSSPTSPEAPTSPVSPGGPHSPLWGPHSPGTEKRIDELQEESRRLAEGEPPKGQTEGGKTGAVNAADPTEEALQNGQEKTTGLDAIEGVATKGLSPLPDESTAVLTNGSTAGEVETNHITSELDIPTSAAPEPEVVASDDIIATAPLCHVHTEPGLVSLDADEDVLVMRAERVIILTDDDLPPQGQEEEEEEHEEEEAKAKEASGPLEPAQGEAEGATVAKVEVAPLDSTGGDAPVVGDAVSNKAEEVEGGGGEGGEGGVADCGSIAPDSDPSLQSPDGSAVASVPIYSQQAPPSPLSPRLGPKGETGPEGETGTEAGAPAAAAPGGGVSELASPAPPPSAVGTGLFQEVPLVEAQGSGVEPGEQEPLLGPAKAPQTKAGGAGMSVAAAGAGIRSGPPPGTDAHTTPVANSRGGEEPAVSPKRKTCECCSVM